MKGFLEKAAVAARFNVAAWKERFPNPEVADPGQRGIFLPPRHGNCGVIAEIKRQSPSRGDLLGQSDPLRISGHYEKGGAEAVSVVVEEVYFGGSPELFREIARSTSLPLLWKDFVVDPYQIRLAAGLGASAILLIAAMLSEREMSSFMDSVRKEGLRALVEVHDLTDLKLAVDSGADLIGINNRDLVSLEVDTKVTEELVKFIPEAIQTVSESGIRLPDDVALMADLGCRAVLVGESLVTAENRVDLLRGMVNAGKIGSVT